MLLSRSIGNTPLLPPKICIGIVFDFSWNIFIPQDEILGRLKKCIIGFVQVENDRTTASRKAAGSPLIG